MAFTKTVIEITDMTDGEQNMIADMRIEVAEGDDSCISIVELNDPDAQALWLDIEGATLLRDFINDWLGDK